MNAMGFRRGRKVVALCGGIGGAKLALGLSHVLPPDDLTIIVNTGDDFRHLGLHVSPDIDTVTYTIAGRSNVDTGWGRSAESWRFMEAVAELGGETWFNLGDTDLATSAVRTARLEQGDRLTEVALDFARALGARQSILPVTDDPLRTLVETDEGLLPFQRYFVGRRCQPVVRALHFEGAGQARLTPECVSALHSDNLGAIVICPSNPFLSLNPMLAVPGLRDRLRASPVPVIAISPIVGGNAIKGPLAKMLQELGLPVSPQAIANEYADFLDVLVVDGSDGGLPVNGPDVHLASIVMRSLEDKIALARETLSISVTASKRGVL